MEITNRYKLIEYIKRMIRTCQYTGVNDIQIWNDNARKGHCSLSGSTLCLSFQGDLLDSTNNAALDALKVYAGHELAHLIIPELQIKENYRPWKNDSKENHIKSLLRCCIETACDIWGYDMCKKTLSTDRLYNIGPSLVRLLDNYKQSEIKDMVGNIKRGRLTGNTRRTLMFKKHDKSNIQYIVIEYYNTMKYIGIEIDIGLYCTVIENMLKRDYPVTYAILTGTYKYPRLHR